jgi:hypothetical protein
MSSIWTESLASCPRARAPGSSGQPTNEGSRFQSRPSNRAGDGQPRGRRRGADQREATRVLGCSLARHSWWVDAQDRVDPDRTGPATSVPSAGTDVRALVTHARTLERPAAVASLVRRHSWSAGTAGPPAQPAARARRAPQSARGDPCPDSDPLRKAPSPRRSGRGRPDFLVPGVPGPDSWGTQEAIRIGSPRWRR